MELAIDTSTNTAGIALSEQGRIMSEMTWDTGQNHTVELIPKLVTLLEQQEIAITDINEIVVAKGPGSFNGLRVGLATAKGLAFALGIGMVCISTLEAIAFAHADIDLPVYPILQAGRGEIATAIFSNQSGKWTSHLAEYVTTIKGLCSSIKEQSIICGEITIEQQRSLNKELGNRAFFPQESSDSGRAGYLAKLGWCRIEAGDFDDPSTIQPLYLKKPSITKPQRRKNDALSNMRAGI